MVCGDGRQMPGHLRQLSSRGKYPLSMPNLRDAILTDVELCRTEAAPQVQGVPGAIHQSFVKESDAVYYYNKALGYLDSPPSSPTVTGNEGGRERSPPPPSSERASAVMRTPGPTTSAVARKKHAGQAEPKAQPLRRSATEPEQARLQSRVRDNASRRGDSSTTKNPANHATSRAREKQPQESQRLRHAATEPNVMSPSAKKIYHNSTGAGPARAPASSRVKPESILQVPAHDRTPRGAPATPKSSRMTPPDTLVTYVVPSDGGHYIPRDGSKQRRALIESAVMQKGTGNPTHSPGSVAGSSTSKIRVSRLSDVQRSPGISVIPSPGINVSRWRAEQRPASISTSSSPPTEVTQREPTDPGSPSMSEYVRMNGRSARQDVEHRASTPASRATSKQHTLSDSETTRNDTDADSDLGASPIRHVSVHTPTSAPSYPDVDDDEEPSRSHREVASDTYDLPNDSASQMGSVRFPPSSTSSHPDTFMQSLIPISCHHCLREMPEGQLVVTVRPYMPEQSVTGSSQRLRDSPHFGLSPAHARPVTQLSQDDPRSPMGRRTAVPLDAMYPSRLSYRPSPTMELLSPMQSPSLHSRSLNAFAASLSS
ncbi:hypothetical protein PLICRDRAFT_473111 [Plicaturopsis crispa FD-325 SS-3]|nr:hypothetical protein PLICRDRAFT_473111 [Plicaturopsis crispa FD-325 SS-3]